jgi:hypothetical protein
MCSAAVSLFGHTGVRYDHQFDNEHDAGNYLPACHWDYGETSDDNPRPVQPAL